MTLFFWGARALYLGPAFGLSPHRNAVPVLCAGVHGPFEVARDPRRPRAGFERHRTVLIPANRLHHLRAGEELMAFLYVDAHSEDFRRLRASATGGTERQAHGLAGEAAYLKVLKETTGVPFRRYRVWTRMGAAVRALAGGTPLTDAALDAGFSSSSHFSAAFREMFGMTPSRLARAGLRIERRA
jgi:hypothetical protein